MNLCQCSLAAGETSLECEIRERTMTPHLVRKCQVGQLPQPPADLLACEHRGDLLGEVDCGCATPEKLYQCNSPDVDSETCTRSKKKTPWKHAVCVTCEHRKSTPIATPFAVAFDKASKNVPSPPGWARERGIVICAGGWRFFPSLYVTVKLIRSTGCTLPIQVWHLGAVEYEPLMGHLLDDCGVEWVDAYAFQKAHPKWRFELPSERNPGWAIKALAAAASPFAEVISFDADCYPIGNPEDALGSREYKANGAIFFPDIPTKSSEVNASNWEAFGLEPRNEREWESGQFIIDKRRNWPATWLSFWLNSYSRLSYQHVYGDKDTFLMAWRKAGGSVAVHHERPYHRTVGFLQRLPNGTEYSVHRCNDKFRLPEIENRFMSHQQKQQTFMQSMPREQEAHDAFEEFKDRYNQPTLLIVGHPKGGSTYTWKQCAELTGLMTPKVSAGEIFNDDRNSDWKHRHWVTSPDAVKDAAGLLAKWSRAACIKGVCNPYLMISAIRQAGADIRVLYVHRDPAIVREKQAAVGWHHPDPAGHIDALRSIADAEIEFDTGVLGGGLVSVLRRLGYSV